MKYKMRKKPFYQIVAEAIIEGAPFDVSENGDGWKRVQELLTLYMLRELNEASKYKVWRGYLAKVDGVFDVAVKFINENPKELPEYANRHVYKYIPVNKRNVQFLAIQVSYRKAKKRNTDRLIKRMETAIRPAIKEIQKTQPERLVESRERATKLLS